MNSNRGISSPEAIEFISGDVCCYKSLLTADLQSLYDSSLWKMVDSVSSFLFALLVIKSLRVLQFIKLTLSLLFETFHISGTVPTMSNEQTDLITLFIIWEGNASTPAFILIHLELNSRSENCVT